MIIAQVLNYNIAYPSAVVQRTGPHDVGTLRTRLRIDGGTRRSLTVRLWYPAEGTPTPTSRLRTLFARLRHPSWAPAQHRAQLPSAQSQFPLITYLPDAPGLQQDNTHTLANLASHGFILAAIQNPFVSDNGWPQRLAAHQDDPFAGSGDRQTRSGVIAASELLDALSELKPDGPIGAWAGRFDLKRAGILGFASGGTVAVATSAVDSRYVAAANLDGVGAGSLVKVPYLLMRSDRTLQDADHESFDNGSKEPQPVANGTRTQASLPTSHIIEVAGTRREHFSDRLMNLVRSSHGAKRAVGLRVRAIIDAYTVAFFQTYLGATPHPLMCVRHSPYPEVRFINGDESEFAHRLAVAEGRDQGPRSDPH
jgi:predicted dienelactone hydrolase